MSITYQFNNQIVFVSKNIIMIRSQSYCFLCIIMTIYFFIFLHPLLNTFASSPTRSLCRSDQRDALLELRKEFPIYSNDIDIGTTVWWNKSVDCCSWIGVKCDAMLGEVILLELCFTVITVNTSLKSSSVLFKLQHLTHLDLSYCNLQGEIPSSIGNLSRLISLDLSYNQLVGEVPTSIRNLNQLESINLHKNHLRGNILTSFANFTNLLNLNLRENKFTGGVRVLANLTSLSDIDISFNHFKSSIPSYYELHNLYIFWGYGNSFFGPFPTSLLKLPWLDEIDLSGNQFEGSIDFGNTSSSSMLRVLHVGNNNFDGLIPESISKLINLEGLVLSHNNFRGEIPRSISKLGNLLSLDLSHNNFRGEIPRSISKLGNLLSLDLSHNNFRGEIPRSISKLGNLLSLDLSHNNLGGRVPRSISKLVNLTSVDLSYNKLEGQVPPCIWTSSDLLFLRLSHNSFTSFENSVEIINETLLELLDLGSNSLQGPFPQWICNYLDLSYLDLSNNHFTGSIPRCLKNFSLIGLNLRNNSLSGFVPDLCINGYSLQSLDVSRNNLVGKLPKSLINCKYMEFLNVKGNMISDTFPFWLGSLQNLMVLVLRSNAFHGPVYNSSAYLGFPSMKIIDISNNNFVGSLPQDYFAKWLEMSKVWSDEGTPEMNYMSVNFTSYDSIDLVYKGVDTNFLRIFQGFRAIDFSGNRFYGHIPGSIGLLSELRLLNLSGNTFTGNIPPSLANITNLETLDLSRNNLSGEIPQGLGKLTFLSNINFSYNHLEGFVPRSTQFGSQNCSSFVGNPGLYGLDDICKDIHVPEESLSEQDEPVLNWIAAAIAFGPGVFCGLVIGYIFTSYKHEWFILSR